MAQRCALVLLVLLMGCRISQETPATTVETDLRTLAENGALPLLAPPFSAEATTRIREQFDWEATLPLAERDPEGHPALYYMLVFVSTEKEEELLDLMQVTHSPIPLFAEERRQWAGQSGIFNRFGDDVGHFEFVILPGVLFNILRDLARSPSGSPRTAAYSTSNGGPRLAATRGSTLGLPTVQRGYRAARRVALETRLAGSGRVPPFRAVLPADSPPEARHGMGTLRYAYLVDHGFTYGLDGRSAADRRTTGKADEAFFFAFLALFAASHDVRDAVDDVLSSLDREVRGKVTLHADLRVHQTDAAFGAPEAEYSQAWRGGHEPMRLRGVPMVAQSDMGTVRQWTNAQGRATMEIAHGQLYTLCARAQNHAAAVSHSDRPVHLCVFEASGPGFTGGNQLDFSARREVTQRLLVSDYHFNIIAQMTDAHDYIEEVFGYRMSRAAAVLVGPAADVIGEFNENRAFAMCGGYNTFATHSLVLALGGAGVITTALVDPVTTFRIAGHDLVFPQAAAQRASHTRHVPIHEYGHFLMCELIALQGYDKITEALFDLIWTVFTERQRPEVSNLVYTEAFADFLTSRVAGGMDYVSLPGVETDPNINNLARAGSQEYYCHPLATACLEDNVGGPRQITPAADIGDPFAQRVAQHLTLLHDAFDGRVRRGRAVTSGAYYAQDASGQFRTLPAGAHGVSDAGDEEVALPASALLDLFVEWGRWHGTISVEAFSNSLARVALNHGFSETQVCHLFALHALESDCRTLVDLGALDIGRATPSQPVILRLEPLSDSELEAFWEDLSPFRPTGFVWDLRAEDGGTRIGTTTYRGRVTERLPSLEPDTRYVLGVRTVNGALRSEEASAEAVTLAERVPSIILTPQRGAMTVSWNRRRATAYVVEITTPEGVREVPAAGTAATIGGLDEGADYTFRVYSVNQVGRRSEASVPAAGSVLAPAVVHLSWRHGNDQHPDAGNERNPYRTLDAAIRGAQDRDANKLKIEEGRAYVSSTVHTISRDLVIEGGYRTTDGIWTKQAGVPARVRLTAADPVAGCLTRRFNIRGRSAVAGVRVTLGAELHLVDLILDNAATPSPDTCGAAVHLEGASLVMQDSEISGDWRTAGGGCATAVQGVITGGRAPSIQIRASRLLAQGGAGDFFDTDTAGVCLAGASSVYVESSQIAAVTAGGWVRPAPASIIGLALSDVASLRVARSTVSSLAPAPSAFLSSSSAGFVSGLEATVTGSALIDNSVIRTHTGGDRNNAVEIGSGSNSPRSIDLYQVMAAAGGDWRLGGAIPSGFRGAAVNVTGDLSATELGIVNSTLAYAAGGRETRPIPAKVSALNRSETRSNPRRLRLLGNVFSVPGGVIPAAYARCPQDEFGVIYSDDELNTASKHACVYSGAFADTRSWESRSNIGLKEPAEREGQCTQPCEPGFYCDLGSNCRERPDLRCLSFDDDGYPDPVDLRLIFDESGVPLAGLPHAAAMETDIRGRARDQAQRQGAGAFLRR